MDYLRLFQIICALFVLDYLWIIWNMVFEIIRFGLFETEIIWDYLSLDYLRLCV